MKNYKIITYDENSKVIIFINNLDDIYYMYEEIYSEFSKKYGKEFSIIIDLFLRNGFSFNRFAMLNFKDETTVDSVIINPGDISEESKRDIRDYLKNNLQLLENSCLTKSMKDFVINH